MTSDATVVVNLDDVSLLFNLQVEITVLVKWLLL